MTRLFIDNKEAVISPETNFKITRENPYFTQASSYTNEIELPMLGCIENQKIFGAINRIEVKKNKLAFKARLTVGDEVVLMGTATIIGVTKYSVKIQIVSGVSEINFRSKFEGLYIDELDLGDAMEGMPVYDKNGDIVEEKAPKDWASIPRWLETMPKNRRIECVFGSSDERDWVLVPAMDKRRNRIVNQFIDGWDEEHKESCYPDVIWIIDLNMAPQPYWCFLIERVIEACGYKVKKNQMRDVETKNFYFPNATHTIYFAEMMPHMTVTEFITAVENYFGLIIVIDEGKENEATIYLRERFMEIGQENIEEVKDEFNIEIKENVESDLSNSDIKYKGEIEDDTIHYLSDEIIELAQYVTKETKEEAEQFYESAKEEDKVSTICEVGGMQYIYYEGKVKECNQFRKLKSSGDASEIEIKIEPAIMTNVMRSFSIPAPQVESKSGTNTINIENVINGESVDNSKFEHLYAAIYTGYKDAEYYPNVEVGSGETKYKVNTFTPFGWTHGIDDTSGNNLRPKYISMMLNKVDGFKTMYDMVYSRIMRIDTKKTYEITFFDDKYFSPINTYIIRGKKFACNKIEYKITLKGMNKEKVGTFYLLPE